MIGYHQPKLDNCFRTVIDTPSVGAGQYIAFRRNRRTSMMHLFLIGAGSGGGGGYGSSSNAASGGGGGAAATIGTFLYPAWCLPDVLYCFNPLGGRGGAGGQNNNNGSDGGAGAHAYVCVDQSTTDITDVGNIIAMSGYGTAPTGGGGGTTASGAAGVRSATVTSTFAQFAAQSIFAALGMGQVYNVNDANSNGSAGVSTSTSSSKLLSTWLLTGGTGGSGCNSAGASPGSVGSITGYGPFPTIPGASGSYPFGAPGYQRIPEFLTPGPTNIMNGMMRLSGGTGGYYSTGSNGNSYDGGNAGYGCGGGGGGAAFGSNFIGGKGGDGGRALIVITEW